MCELIECLSCHGEFSRDEMSTGQTSRRQVCIGCNTKIRALHRADLHAKKQAAYALHLGELEMERRAKKKQLADAISSGARETPILTRYSETKAAQTKRNAAAIIEDRLIAKQFDIEVSDFT
jgi:hypothetical protein